MDFWTISYSKDQSLRQRHGFLSTSPEIIHGSGLMFTFLFQVRSFIQQILEGLGHIHSLNILHLDIKVGGFGFISIPDFAVTLSPFERSIFISPTQPDNILMVYPPRDEIKICDFGFCQEMDSSRHQYSMLGTPEFVAPEIVHLEPVTVATDIWWV